MRTSWDHIPVVGHFLPIPVDRCVVAFVLATHRITKRIDPLAVRVA
jgi:hypothetical protein